MTDDVSRSSADPGRPRTVAEPPPFPQAIHLNGRLYFSRHGTENYKLALAGLPPKDFEGPDELVPAKQLAVELGVHRRTIARRVLEDEKTSGKGEIRRAAYAARFGRAGESEAKKAAIVARARATRLAQSARRAAEEAAAAEEVAKAARARGPCEAEEAAAADQASDRANT
jgi:hypothetical protein